MRRLFGAGETLRWYEYVWAVLPFGLVVAGGAIGGACGGAAAWCNVRLMQGSRPAWQKYLETGATSVAAVGAYLILARLFLSVAGLGGMTAGKVDQELARRPAFVAIQKVDPATYADIRSIIVDGQAHRRPELEIETAVQTKVAAIVRKSAPIAGDRAVFNLTRVMTLEIDQIGAKNADACVDFLFPRPGRPPVPIAELVSADVIAQDYAATGAVIESAAANPQPIPQQQQIAPALKRIVSALSRRFGAAKVAALARPNTMPHDQLCMLTSELYKDVLDLPADEGAPLLRFLFAQGPV